MITSKASLWPEGTFENEIHHVMWPKSNTWFAPVSFLNFLISLINETTC